MHETKALRRNFLWNTFGQVAYMASQFLCGILVIRLAGTEDSGYYNVALNLTNIFLSLASYGMYSFQVSDFTHKYSPSCYIKSRVYTCALACILCGGYTIFGSLIGQNKYGATQIWCIVLFLAYRMLESGSDIYNAINQQHERLDTVGKGYALRGLMSFASFVIVLFFTHNMVMTLGVMVLTNLVVFFKYTRAKTTQLYQAEPVEIQAVKTLLVECAPLAVYSVISTTTASIPKLVMERMLGSEALGIYGPVTQPVLLLQVGATYLFNPFITVFAKAYVQKNASKFIKACLTIQAILLCLIPFGIVFAAAFGEWGLRVFVSPELVSYQSLLIPMVVSAVLTAMVLFYSMVLTVMRCMKGLIFANVCGIITAALISVPSINHFGMQGATVASVGALLVQCVCLLVILVIQAYRHFKSDTPLPKPDDPFDGLPS